MTPPTRRGRNWVSKRRSGRWPIRCACGSSATGCRWRCTWTGRTCTSGRPTPGERLRGEEPVTQFGRMCAKLDIAIIAASSPQAKGRVERVHGTHQDRLVKKLRRKEISSHEARQRVSRAGLFAGTQPAFRAGGRQSGGLSPSRAARCRTGPEFSGSRANARLATTGWCATTTGFFSSSRRVAITRQLRGKYWCAKGGTATSPSSIEAARCGGRRFRHPASRVGRSSGPVSQFRRRPKRSGCRQRITRGERRLAERWRSACPRRPSQPGRCWPGPPLRPKRSALRAPQDCAPDQANRAAKNRGCCRSTEIGIVVPRTP